MGRRELSEKQYLQFADQLSQARSVSIFTLFTLIFSLVTCWMRNHHHLATSNHRTCLCGEGGGERTAHSMETLTVVSSTYTCFLGAEKSDTTAGEALP